MTVPAGWYPDPSGRHQLRHWDGQTWTDWVSSAGQVGAEALPSPPATGGGSLTTEPVIHAQRVGAQWWLTSLYGAPLAVASRSERQATVADPGGTTTHQLQLASAGSTAVVAVMGADGHEVGRFEEVRRAYLGGFRLVGLGALLATLDAESNDLRRLVLVDPGRRPIGRVGDDGGRWTTELAHPLGTPLHELAAVAALAVDLAWR